MTTPYDKILKKGESPPKKKPNAFKANLHRISFDDSDDSERIEIPNIFLNDREVSESNYAPPPPKKKHREVPRPRLEKLQSAQEFNLIKSPSKKAKPIQKQPSLDLQEQIAQPQPQLQPHSSLSLLQILKLNLGQFLFRNKYPLRKTIYVNNNNQEENEINEKEYLLNNKTEIELNHFNNSLTTGNLITIIALLLRNTLGYLYIYAWIAIIVLQFIAENVIFKRDIQYANSKSSMITILVIAVVVQTFSDWISFRKRKNWQENTQNYKVYHHNGHLAQWVSTKATEIKAGNVYKIQSGDVFPTDCVLIYSQNSMLQINETAILSQLVEHPSEITLKQTLIKSQNFPLPLSGYLSYQITNPEYTDYQIVGKLNLQEPQKIAHAVSVTNIILRGSINSSKAEAICMAMETGIDSIFLKSIQYPFCQRKQYQYSSPSRSKSISSEANEELKDFQGTMLGCNLQKKVESTIFAMLIMYFLVIGLGVLARFAFSLTIANEFFLASSNIAIWKIAIYHSINYLIMIPVLLFPMYKLFLAFSSAISESNISKRAIEIINQTDQNKRTTSLIESASQHKHQELLDHKKIVFPIKIKDYNLLPQLCKVDTIITTIDTFRDHSAYTLHSVRVKEINHNLLSNNLDNQAYSTSDMEVLKHFMSVALLTSTKKEYDYRQNQPMNYDQGIEFAAKKYFDLQKNKNAKGETIVGNGQFVVKELFHIDPIYDFPYKIVFLEPITQAQDQNKRILVLIRGNTKVILDKCYGKEVKLTEDSRKLQQEKGYHVQLLAKLTLHSLDVAEIQRAYFSANFETKLFYNSLDKYISKVESMGLLVFVNQFHQKKIGEALKNPILNQSLLNPDSSKKNHSPFADFITSQMMPNIVILAPPSKSSQPQFESIHTITNLLISPYLFHLSLAQVGDKIIHEKPSDLDRMFSQLDQERILVWNGWDQKDITYTIDVMKLYGRNILFYTEKDQYIFLMKQANFSVKGSQQGYDAEKYSDITLTSQCSISYLSILQLIKYDSVAVRQGILSLLLTQIGKYVLYLIVQAINIFYTRGTALIIMKSPFFLVFEFILFTDVLYYLNWKDCQRVWTFSKQTTYFKQTGLKVIEKILQGIFVTLICIYSTQTPSSSNGTPHPYQYTYFTIAFSLIHVLVFEKLFNILNQSLSIFKGVVLLGQLALIYLSFLIVSLTDTYHYKGILWNALSSGNIFITVIASVWVSLSLPALRLLWSMLGTKQLRVHQSKRAS